MAEPKTSLTFEEKITCAFMHYVRGIAQQDIAIMMGGVNAGRVNEACLAIRKTLMPPGSAETSAEYIEKIDAKLSQVWKNQFNG